jgi:hypothetical protein
MQRSEGASTLTDLLENDDDTDHYKLTNQLPCIVLLM